MTRAHTDTLPGTEAPYGPDLSDPTHCPALGGAAHEWRRDPPPADFYCTHCLAILSHMGMVRAWRDAAWARWFPRGAR